MNGDLIQFGIFIVLAITLIAICLQLRVQNKVLQAQLLKDRYDMYIKTYSPVTDDEIKSFTDYPEDWISRDIFEKKYKGNKNKIRRYLMISRLYEYLAFTYHIRKLDLPDLLGDQWIDSWTLSLLETEEFTDVHNYYEGYYPHFKKYITSLKNHKNA